VKDDVVLITGRSELENRLSVLCARHR
jgi:hypothetical protein